MTLFEEILKEIGAAPGSEAEQKVAELVNKFIFSDRDYTDGEIKKSVVKYFKNY